MWTCGTCRIKTGSRLCKIFDSSLTKRIRYIPIRSSQKQYLLHPPPPLISRITHVQGCEINVFEIVKYTAAVFEEFVVNTPLQMLRHNGDSKSFPLFIGAVGWRLREGGLRQSKHKKGLFNKSCKNFEESHKKNFNRRFLLPYLRNLETAFGRIMWGNPKKF